jgi:hypothetical protein
MKRLVATLILVSATIAPAFADDEYKLVKDTVGNCSAVVSSERYPGMTIVSDKTYGTWQEGQTALDNTKECEGIVK